MTRPPVDFKRLKEVSLEDAISFLSELKLTKREGQQLRFACPACGSEDERELSINTTKGFRCFASGKKGDDAVALVAHVRRISQYDAGRLLQDHHFPERAHAPQAPSPARAEPEGRRGPLQPLDYLEPSHQVAEMLGLSAATLEALGGGYAPKGTMAGRIAIPIRMEDGTLVGYFGIATKEEIAPLLKFPDNLEERCTSLKSEPRSRTAEPDQLRKLFRVVG